MPQRKGRGRVISISVLPGEKTDGSGRVCIHLFIQVDGSGVDHTSFTEPHALHQAVDDIGQPIKGQLVARPTRGRLACGVVPAQISPSGPVKVTHRTDDPRAVTCPKCMTTDSYKLVMERLSEGNK